MSRSGKQITIILPSFRDMRIVDAIASVRAFDDIDASRIVIVDGGSGQDFLELVAPLLQPDDVLISEPDRGIFDALNKGLDLVETSYVGWLGCDDVYAADAKSSKVVAALEAHDLYVMDMAIVRDGCIRRRTHSWPSSVGLVRWGLHNPHYSTFGRRELLCKHRFRLDIRGSDIAYFLDVFRESPKVLCDRDIGMLMAEGGYSSSGYRQMASTNLELFRSYRDAAGPLRAICALSIKVGYKVLALLQYKLLPQSTEKFLQPGIVFSDSHPARARV